MRSEAMRTISTTSCGNRTHIKRSRSGCYNWPVRHFLCLLLLICLPLQSFAAQMGDVQRVTPAGMAHELDHLQERLHHHHDDDDGAVHYDNSEESQEHSEKHSHCCVQLLFKPMAALFTPFDVPLAKSMAVIVSTPHPYLDGPHRPPAFAPGLAAGG